MSKSNVEKVIGEILSDEKRLPEFLACEDQDELYRYCLEKGSGYTREEFDEFVEETIEKAGEGINQSSSKIGRKIGQVFSKVLAAGLAVFSAVPAVQNFMPQQVGAFDTVEGEETQTAEEAQTIEEADANNSNSRRGNRKSRTNKKANVEKGDNPVVDFAKNNKLATGLGALAAILGTGLAFQTRRLSKANGAAKSAAVHDLVCNIGPYDTDVVVGTKIGDFNNAIGTKINGLPKAFGANGAGIGKGIDDITNEIGNTASEQYKYFVRVLDILACLSSFANTIVSYLRQSAKEGNAITGYSESLKTFCGNVKLFSEKLGNLDSLNLAKIVDDNLEGSKTRKDAAGELEKVKTYLDALAARAGSAVVTGAIDESVVKAFFAQASL